MAEVAVWALEVAVWALGVAPAHHLKVEEAAHATLTQVFPSCRAQMARVVVRKAQMAQVAPAHRLMVEAAEALAKVTPVFPSSPVQRGWVAEKMGWVAVKRGWAAEKRGWVAEKMGWAAVKRRRLAEG